PATSSVKAAGLVGATTVSPSSPTSVLGEQISAPSTTVPVQVLGETLAASGAPAQVDAARSGDRASGTLPFTGGRVLLLVLAGLGLVAAGGVALRTVRRSPA